MSTDDNALENETEVLFPHRRVTVGGEPVEVRELTFWQGLEAAPLAEPMIADLFELFKAGAIEPDLTKLGAVFGRHRGATLKLMSLSTGLDADTIAALPDSDGQTLLMAFWGANLHFFVTRLVQRRESLAIRDHLNQRREEAEQEAEALKQELASAGYSVS